MADPSVEPAVAQFPASGGKCTHVINNPTESRMAYKIKTSDNDLYKVSPVFGFIEPGTQMQFEVTRSSGPAKEDKMIVQLAPAAPECTDPKEPFAGGGAFPDLPVQLKAE